MQKNHLRFFSRFARISVCVMVGFCLISPFISTPVFAQGGLQGGVQQVDAVAAASGISSSTNLITMIGRIINIFLSVLGIIFLVLMLYAGYLWMTSAGDPKKVDTARSIIKNAVIGLIIIMSAWAITAFVLGFLAGDQFGGLGSFMPTPRQTPGLPRRAGALGAGIIESHMPERGAINVPRNTPIIITFKQAIKPDSFIKDWSQNNSYTGLNTDVVKIYRTKDGVDTAFSSEKARVSFTEDKKTFVIRLVEPELFGSPNVNVMYTVELAGGATGVLKEDGKPAFAGSFGDGYMWQFEVSTQLDLTPPYVTAVVPTDGIYAQNIIVQINFNKAIDPTSASGRTVNGFQNIQVLSGKAGQSITNQVEGEFRISNQYRTVEFIPERACGTNSCGRTIFCLPEDAVMEVAVKAATLSPSAPAPSAELTQNGYNGVVSIVGNSLDGNKNGKGEGPPNDNYSWRFGTSKDVKLSPPQITKTQPSSFTASSWIPLDQPIEVTFDSLLQSSTINSSNAMIDAYGYDEKEPDTFWWSAGMQLLREGDSPLNPSAVPPDIATHASIQIFHRQFLKSKDTYLNYYDPHIYSGVQDAYQNCFNPAALCGASQGTGSPNCCNGLPSPEGCERMPTS